MKARRENLLGRDRELAQLHVWLRGAGALLAIIGLPGVGKSALVNEGLSVVAPSLRVLRCDLATLDDFDAVCLELGRQLGRATPRPQVNLVGWLAEGLATEPTLVVLHDLERMLGARPLLVELAKSVGVRMLLTSRVKLDLQGEVLELQALPQPEELNEDNPAIRLFLRECDARGVTLNMDATVLALVRSLGGLPLAIQLAAGRTRLLSPRALLNSLEKSYEALRDSSAQNPGGHHASLERELALSFELLSPEARLTLSAAALFRDEFDVDALSAATALPQIFDALEELRGASFLVLPTQDRGRFTLLPVIRWFARAQLEKRSESFLVRLRIARFFAARCRELRGELESVDSRCADAILLGVRNDLLDAADVLIAEGEVADAVAVVVSLRLASRRIDDMSGLSQLFERVLSRIEHAPSEVQGEAFIAATTLNLRLGKVQDALGIAKRLHKVARELSRPAWCASALRFQAHARLMLGETEGPLGLIAEALCLAESVADHGELCSTHHLVASLFRHRGVWSEARRHIRMAEEFARQLGPRVVVDVLIDAASIDLELCDTNLANDRVVLALQLVREQGLEKSRLLVVLRLLQARIHHALGELALASEHYLLAERGARLRGDPLIERIATFYGALVVWERGDLRRAVDCLRVQEGLAVPLEEVHGAWIRAMLGGAEGLLGNLSEAERAIESGLSFLRAAGADALATAAEACWGFLDLARAERAVRAGDWPLDARLRAQVTARIDSFETRQSVEAAIVARLLRRSLESPASATPRWTLRVARSGAWFSAGDQKRVSCTRRPTMRRLLVAMVEAHQTRPGATLSRAQLLKAGWPGERMMERAAHRRLEVMISRMRELGLRDLLETVDGHYALAASCRIDVQDS